MLEQPPVPDWIRAFSYPGWTNVFQLGPTNDHLYPLALRAEWKSQFNDWNGPILLLAKDGCPTRAIRDCVEKGESQPWRYAQRELGDARGWRTNERLANFAYTIPGGKLYGSATANMLYDDPRWSRSLPGFYDGPLNVFLQRVLCWVADSMPKLEYIACLGAESWFLTCQTMENFVAAADFQQYRDSRNPVDGRIGEKEVGAFPLYHPAARVSTDLMESGWRAFAKKVRSPTRPVKVVKPSVN
jgi:hypothetical protein